MGDHFVLLVDRLVTESSLEAAIESRNLRKQLSSSPSIPDTVVDCSSHIDSGMGRFPREVVECRICQDEDVDSNMETPCSCCGSLKYAHRRCVQRWCNEKGDTMCEICLQQFQPGYTAPPPMFQLGSIPMNLRGNWGISRRELNSPHFVAMVSANRHFLDPDHGEYEASASRSLMCCRSVAVIFMFLLVLRHTLPFVIDRAESYSMPLFLLLILRTSGIILPVYIMLAAVTALHRCRHQLASTESHASSEEEETGRGTLAYQPRIIQVC